MSNVWILSDTAYVQYVHNKPLSWVNDTVLEKLRILSGYDFKFMFDSTEKSLLSCGQCGVSVVYYDIVVSVMHLWSFMWSVRCMCGLSCGQCSEHVVFHVVSVVNMWSFMWSVW